jgi:hypothetical protein
MFSVPRSCYPRLLDSGNLPNGESRRKGDRRHETRNGASEIGTRAIRFQTVIERRENVLLCPGRSHWWPARPAKVGRDTATGLANIPAGSVPRRPRRRGHSKANTQIPAFYERDSTALWHRSCNAAMQHTQPSGRAACRTGAMSVGRKPREPSVAHWPNRHMPDAGGEYGFEASAPTRDIRPAAPHLFPYPSSDAHVGGAGGKRTVNIKMPPDQICVSSSGADPLAPYIPSMGFNTLNGAADARGR